MVGIHKRTGDAVKFLAATEDAMRSRLEKEEEAASDVISKGISPEEFTQE